MLPDAQGRKRFSCKTFMAGVARPIDVKTGNRGEIYIAEFTRATSNAEGLGLPGRILVLKPTDPGAAPVVPVKQP